MINLNKKSMYVKIKKVRDHYEIFIKGSFYCSCELNEIKETKEEIKDTFNSCEIIFV